MKIKIFLTIFYLMFTVSSYCMEEKIEKESPRNMLFRGITEYNLDLVNNALTVGVDANSVAKNGQPALISAVIQNQIDIVRLLLNVKTNPNIQNKYNQTALGWAAALKSESITKLLLQANADLNLPNIPKETLIMAAKTQCKNIIELLIKANADVNMIDHEGKTALMYAAEYESNADIVNLLLQANSHIKTKDNYNNSALEIAKGRCSKSIQKMLQDEPARRWFNWVKIRSEISETTSLIPDIANIVAEYLAPEEDYEEYFV